MCFEKWELQNFRGVMITFSHIFATSFAIKSTKFDYSPHPINALQKRYYGGFFLNSRRSHCFFGVNWEKWVCWCFHWGESQETDLFSFHPCSLLPFPSPHTIVIDPNNRLNSKAKGSCTQSVHFSFTPTTQSCCRWYTAWANPPKARNCF